jgi:hypothetical protein
MQATRTLPGRAALKAVLARLNETGRITDADVFDTWAPTDEARKYLVVWLDGHEDDSSFNTFGCKTRIQIHAFTPKGEGYGPTDDLLSQALAAITDPENPLTVPGWGVVDIEFEVPGYVTDPGGVRHGVLQLDVWLDQ